MANGVVTVEQLKQQLASSEADIAQGRALFHRAEGMALLLKHQIELAEAPEEASSAADTSSTPAQAATPETPADPEPASRS